MAQITAGDALIVDDTMFDLVNDTTYDTIDDTVIPLVDVIKITAADEKIFKFDECEPC